MTTSFRCTVYAIVNDTKANRILCHGVFALILTAIVMRLASSCASDGGEPRLVVDLGGNHGLVSLIARWPTAAAAPSASSPRRSSSRSSSALRCATASPPSPPLRSTPATSGSRSAWPGEARRAAPCALLHLRRARRRLSPPPPHCILQTATRAHCWWVSAGVRGEGGAAVVGRRATTPKTPPTAPSSPSAASAAPAAAMTAGRRRRRWRRRWGGCCGGGSGCIRWNEVGERYIGEGRDACAAEREMSLIHLIAEIISDHCMSIRGFRRRRHQLVRAHPCSNPPQPANSHMRAVVRPGPSACSPPDSPKVCMPWP
jgi:hypothetical protein